MLGLSVHFIHFWYCQSNTTENRLSNKCIFVLLPKKFQEPNSA